MRKKLSLSFLLILPFVAYFLGFVQGSDQFNSHASLPTPAVLEERDLSLLWQVWDTVAAKYVDGESLTDEQLMYGAVKGVVHSIGDPFSEFLDPDESKAFLDDLNGTLTGIGAEVGIRNDVLTVISPLRGSPAEKAGLLPGDHIFKINGVISADFSVFEAVQHIRGEAGSTVVLTVLRSNELQPHEIAIVRDFITIESVTVAQRDDGIAVITVAAFADDTATEFAKALQELALTDPTGVVIDLRFNGGGYLDAAVNMTSKVLASGDVVMIRERGLPDQVLSVSGTPILPQTPLVVLINAGSASASEILAGALQDAGRAQIVGEKSFGKGTVQELINSFADGSTLRITVAKWFTPGGRNVTQDGIEPDVVVPMTADDYEAERDPQLEKAIEILHKAS